MGLNKYHTKTKKFVLKKILVHKVFFDLVKPGKNARMLVQLDLGRFNLNTSNNLKNSSSRN